MKENLSNGAIQARKEYFKEWRANNKDKVKSSNEGYWERRAEELKKTMGENCGETIKIAPQRTIVQLTQENYDFVIALKDIKDSRISLIINEIISEKRCNSLEILKEYEEQKEKLSSLMSKL